MILPEKWTGLSRSALHLGGADIVGREEQPSSWRKTVIWRSIVIEFAGFGDDAGGFLAN
jgi:hypothetical protein